MTYTPPVAEQRFVLDHVVRIQELAAHPGFADATPDTVDAILEGAGAFAAGEYAPLNRIGDTVGARWRDGVVTMPEGYRAAYRAFVDSGWGSINGPVAFGGQGLPYALATVVMEDLGTANMGFSLINMLTPGAIEALVAHGSPEQQATWLPKLISGEWNGTMNLTEPQAGSDVGALRTSATPAGDGSWRIKGQKIYITFGEHDLTDNIVHLVLARTPGAPAGTKGISLFLVPKYRLNADGTPGAFNDVRCVSIEHKLGINASPTCTLSFGDNDDCHGWLIGAEMAGMRAMFTMMNNARLNVGLQGVQIAERATQQALGYARDRVQLGQPIIEHPDVRRMLVRMRALTQAARALVYYAAGQADRAHLGDDAARARLDLLTPLAKTWGTDIGCEVASLGVQIHGGMGFVEETGAAQHYRDIRIAPIYEGTNGIQAADLVNRKLPMAGGEVFASLVADIRAEAGDEAGLMALVDGIESVARWMLGNEASVEDRLAGSYPLTTMLSVATAGWLMARQARIAATEASDPGFAALKQVAARYFLDHVVPEAAGLEAAARGGAALFYQLDAETLAA
ncbi:acyl-CoA dehydrogenase [Sphingomonas changnyeongensis]|uniref:3-methylmercaptopropionyl-CoA dehydrogenase n=1 Tax=Sphingomonas changnyeongensis TaxID=2698679 RepID=A0A7Z2NX76_9SPHN|nr:acyl-CoA dehydrogenase [Sphingomonas changnyeongensis]QHL91106.1 acyl-CoA dehydrogenase [Sphingomonas changnyeongensis]